jgi:hypothetical protein
VLIPSEFLEQIHEFFISFQFLSSVALAPSPSMFSNAFASSDDVHGPSDQFLLSFGFTDAESFRSFADIPSGSFQITIDSPVSDQFLISTVFTHSAFLASHAPIPSQVFEMTIDLKGSESMVSEPLVLSAVFGSPLELSISLDISESGDLLSSAPKIARSPPEYSRLAISRGFRDSLNTTSSDQFAVTREFARAVDEGDADLPALAAGLIGGLILPLALSVLVFSSLVFQRKPKRKWSGKALIRNRLSAWTMISTSRIQEMQVL